MVDRGKVVEDAIRRSGVPITQVAIRIGKSQRHMYNLFGEKELSLEVVIQIGKAIAYDFSAEIPELRNFNPAMVMEPGVTYQNNYEQCLEEKEKIRTELYNQVLLNNDLLQKHVALLEGKLYEYMKDNNKQPHS